MKAILFGNRGSKPLGASEVSPFGKYGGDTTCTGVLFDDGTIISLDAGSGFWKWPYTLKSLAGHDGPYEMHLFFSHYHADHTMGLAQSPFLFDQNNTIHIYGPDFEPGIEEIFHTNANRPYNPDLAEKYQAALEFKTLSSVNSSEVITLENGAEIRWLAVPHGEEQALGFRIDHDGESLVMISDVHHEFDEDGRKPLLDQKIVDFIQGADVLIYDCHFSDQELQEKPYWRNFGHSTGEHGVRLCEAAGVPILVTHHHNPNNDDSVMDNLTGTFRSYGFKKNVYVIPAQPSLCIDLSLPSGERLADIQSQDTPGKRWQKISI